MSSAFERFSKKAMENEKFIYKILGIGDSMTLKFVEAEDVKTSRGGYALDLNFVDQKGNQKSLRIFDTQDYGPAMELEGKAGEWIQIRCEDSGQTFQRGEREGQPVPVWKFDVVDGPEGGAQEEEEDDGEEKPKEVPF